MRTIIAGGRSITEYKLVEEAIEESGFKISCVICGLAKGVDLLGAEWAINNDIDVEYFPADWENHGRSAGIIRNIEMAKMADAVIAIWDGKSRGTKHMIYVAKERELKLHIKMVDSESKEA